ncbi:hypothetical protein [Diaminobutyricimonas sp. LJ205]|uniref:hypothetical protein n=1 Tax=Diaminobutyricimonas sp. LJ205 TaxID=2683590 RepID=UPI0012F51E4C|nr:hypothetical protein [Diaminobutyricimonas sp. LJ205]
MNGSDDALLLPGFHRHGTLILRTGQADEVPYALFENALPSSAEVQQILAEGFGVHLVQVPPEGRDLRFLRQFVGLTHLGVIGVEYDTRAIRELGSLRTLELSVAGAPETDLSGLTNLRTFSGFLHPNESVLRAPGLLSASFQDTREGVVPLIPSQLRELSLISAGNVRQLSPAAADPELTSLVINRTRTFDVASLRAFPRLESISFMQVRELANIEALADLPLRELGLLNVRRVDNLDALGALSDVSIGVSGSLTLELRSVAGRSEAQWDFFRL